MTTKVKKNRVNFNGKVVSIGIEKGTGLNK
jgi:hypothetical protein